MVSVSVGISIRISSCCISMSMSMSISISISISVGIRISLGSSPENPKGGLVKGGVTDEAFVHSNGHEKVLINMRRSFSRVPAQRGARLRLGRLPGGPEGRLGLDDHSLSFLVFSLLPLPLGLDSYPPPLAQNRILAPPHSPQRGPREPRAGRPSG